MRPKEPAARQPRRYILVVARLACCLFLLLHACTARKGKAAVGAPALPSAPSSPLHPQVIQPFETSTFMVFFDQEETILSPSATATLDRVLASLQTAPPGPIRVIGHAGSEEGGIASTTDPVSLSVLRAESVKGYLVANGVPDHRIHTTGMGKGLPLVPDSSKEAAKNRRGEIILPSSSTVSFPAGGPPRSPITIENQVFTMVSGISEYIVGPGDVLDITMWRALEPEKFETHVRPDGRISFGFIEDAPIAGLTILEIDNLLTERLSEFLKKPRIDILVKEYNSKTASIFGGVSRGTIFGSERTGPGTYTLKGKTTLLDLLIRAGGQVENARLERVEVIRRDGKKLVVNLSRAIFDADISQNLVLDDGDVVFVPLRAEDRIFVVGEVGRQGTFLVDERITVLQAIAMAGGFTRDANERRVFIFRGLGDQSRVMVSDVKHIMATGDRTQDTSLANNDVIIVPTSAIGKWNVWMDRLNPTLRNIENVTGILLDIDAMTPGSGTGERGPIFRD